MSINLASACWPLDGGWGQSRQTWATNRTRCKQGVTHFSSFFSPIQIQRFLDCLCLFVHNKKSPPTQLIYMQILTQVSIEDLQAANPHFTVLGHVHLPQQVSATEQGPVMYVGSARRRDFGETEDKRYLTIDFFEDQTIKPGMFRLCLCFYLWRYINKRSTQNRSNHKQKKSLFGGLYFFGQLYKSTRSIVDQ